VTGTVDLVLDRTWAYGPGIMHGGFLLQTLAAAAVTEAHPDPVAVSAHFLSAPRLGAAQVVVEALRTGRSTSTTRTQLVQGGRTCLDAVVTSGRLPETSEPTYMDGAPPVLPPFQDCRRNGPAPGHERNGITEQLDIRLDPAASAWLGERSDRAEVRGWLRATDGSDASALSLVCLADALPPVTFSLGLRGWVPTVQLTVHVRARPAPGWIRAVQRAVLVQGGWLDEQCELWDARDALVAQASQLAMYRA